MDFFQVNRAARSKPFALRFSRSSFELNTCSIASSKVFRTLRIKIHHRFSPTSGSEAAREQTTGVPQAMASRTGKPNPSILDGITSSVCRGIDLGQKLLPDMGNKSRSSR